MLGHHDDVGLAGPVFLVIGVGTVYEEHHVGILVRWSRIRAGHSFEALCRSHFHVAVQLAEDHDRHLQFLGQQFELAAEVATSC